MKKGFLYITILGLLSIFSCNEKVDDLIPMDQLAEDETPISRGFAISIELNDSQEKIADSLHEFSWKLFDQAYKMRNDLVYNNGHKNVLISPFSLLVDLSMLQNGLKGETLEELKNLLGISDFSVDDINKFIKIMVDGIIYADDQISFQSANSFWYNNSLSINPEFASVLSESYQAKLQAVDFSNPETTMLINKWCEDKTNGKINRIIDSTSPYQDFHLLNAIHYKGGWTKQFSKDETIIAPFHNADGSVSEVEMMSNPGISTYYSDMDKYSITRLIFRYGAFNMFMILPKAGYSIDDIISSIRPADLCRSETAIVDLSLPKFEIEYGTDKILNYMQSVDNSFKFRSPDTSIFTDHNTSIDLIIQKAYLGIDEEGSEVAAITDITNHIHGDTTKSAEMHLDRPFIYGIVETSTNMPLFIGYYGN